MQVGLSELSSAVSQLDDGAKTLHEGTEKFKSEGIVPLKDAVDVASADLESFEKSLRKLRRIPKALKALPELLKALQQVFAISTKSNQKNRIHKFSTKNINK